MKRLIPKKWRATFISLLFARLTLNNWRAKFNLPHFGDNALVLDQKEPRDDVVAV